MRWHDRIDVSSVRSPLWSGHLQTSGEGQQHSATMSGIWSVANGTASIIAIATTSDGRYSQRTKG